LAVVDWIESTLDTKLFQSWSTVLGRDYEFIMNAVLLPKSSFKIWIFF